jgi:hypothetical protein
MTSHISSIKVFLASPSDLAAERLAVRRGIDEVNASASKLNQQFELLCWEDRSPDAGRAQAVINSDVDTCDVFIGLLWKRWGQPTGAFSSGFHEEFSKALDRWKLTGAPVIWLAFKHIEPSAIEDAGPQLSQVISFRKWVESQVFFKGFVDEAELERLTRTWIMRFALDRRPLEPSGTTQSDSQRALIHIEQDPLPTPLGTSLELRDALSNVGLHVSDSKGTEEAAPSEYARVLFHASSHRHIVSGPLRWTHSLVETCFSHAEELDETLLVQLYASDDELLRRASVAVLVSRRALQEPELRRRYPPVSSHARPVCHRFWFGCSRSG